MFPETPTGLLEQTYGIELHSPVAQLVRALH